MVLNYKPQEQPAAAPAQAAPDLLDFDGLSVDAPAATSAAAAQVTASSDLACHELLGHEQPMAVSVRLLNRAGLDSGIPASFAAHAQLNLQKAPSPMLYMLISSGCMCLALFCCLPGPSVKVEQLCHA